jgi:hypothetical protein
MIILAVCLTIIVFALMTVDIVNHPEGARSNSRHTPLAN